MRWTCAFLITFVLASHVAAVAAQPSPPTTAAKHLELGATAFAEKRFADAVAHYRAAHVLEPKPMTMVRIAIAAAYVAPLSGSVHALEDWLAEKKRDAQARGDADPSWNSLGMVVTAYREGIRAQESRIAVLESEVATLQRRLAQSDSQLMIEREERRRIRLDFDRLVQERKTALDALDAFVKMQGPDSARHRLPVGGGE